MDEIELRYFIAVAENESVSRAAEKLNISQPAVSMMIRKLENELDAKLFDRSANRVHLNKAGETALLYAKAIIHDADEMKHAVETISQKTMSISIAFADPGVMWYSMPRLEVAYPDMKLRGELYDEDDIVHLLKENKYDIIVSPAAPEENDMEVRPFLSEHVFLSVPEGNSLEGRESIALSDIPAQPLLYPEIGGYFLRVFERLISKRHLPITLVKNPMNLTSYLIRSTNFLTTISTLSIDLRNDGSGRKLIPFTDPELNIRYNLIFMRANSTKAALLDFLLDRK